VKKAKDADPARMGRGKRGGMIEYLPEEKGKLGGENLLSINPEHETYRKGRRGTERFSLTEGGMWGLGGKGSKGGLLELLLDIA